LGEQLLELVPTAAFQQHVPVGARRLELLVLWRRAVDAQRLAAAPWTLPRGRNVGVGRERDLERMAAGASIGDALPRRGRDLPIILTARCTQPRAAKPSFGH